MSGAGRWVASRSASGRTEHIRLYRDDQPLSFSHYFALLRDDPDFANWYTEQLATSPFTAIFWEHPPLGNSNIDTHAEFVLVDAPMLDTLPPNPEAFRSYFSEEAVVSFRNIGGDATLVAPSPIDASTNYAHLAAFLRSASAQQVRSLWHRVAVAVVDTLADGPMWLSTSGLGVAWLHVRLDSSPKYYQHQPYTVWPAATSRDAVDGRRQ